MRIFSLALILLLFCCASGHKRGEEFSYLSMFLERDDDNAELDLDSLYRTYARTENNGKTRKRRRLQHNNNNNNHNNYKKQPVFAGETQSDSYDTSSSTSSTPSEGKNSYSDSDNQDIDNDNLNSNSDSDTSTTKLSTRTTGRSPQEVTTTSLSTSTPEDIQLEDISPTALAERHGEDIVRLQQMIVKLIKQYDIKSMIDVPCRAHAHWIPNVLQRLKQTSSTVRYICVDPNEKVLESIRRRMNEKNVSSSTIDLKYMQRKFWSQGLPKGDMVLSWAGLDNMNSMHVASYLKRLGSKEERSTHKLIVIGTHSGALQKSGNADKIARFTSFGTPINVRKPPFNLARPVRIIKQLATGGNDKQMYVYLPESMFEKTEEE